MKRLLKLVLALTMTTLAVFASLNLTAQPASALYCSPTFLKCTFSDYTLEGDYVCCTYTCPDGREITGVCGLA